MPDRRDMGGFDMNRQLTPGQPRRPSEIARDLDIHRDDLSDTVGELKDDVRDRMERGRRMLHYVPDKLRQAGDAGVRAGKRVGSFARNRPVTTAAIGLGSAALIGGGVMLARRRRAAMTVDETGEEGAKAASGASRKRKTRR
jgi:hypothetical protein